MRGVEDADALLFAERLRLHMGNRRRDERPEGVRDAINALQVDEERAQSPPIRLDREGRDVPAAHTDDPCLDFGRDRAVDHRDVPAVEMGEEAIEHVPIPFDRGRTVIPVVARVGDEARERRAEFVRHGVRARIGRGRGSCGRIVGPWPGLPRGT